MAKRKVRDKRKKGLAKVSPMRLTLLLHLLFVIFYVLVVGTRYSGILRMMEANSWTDDYILHLFRWPLVGALVYAVPMALVGLLFCLFRLRRYAPWTILAPLSLAYFCAPHANSHEGGARLFSAEMNQEEQVCSYVLLADEKKWDELLQTLGKDGNLNTPLGMRYALLAESALGRLPQKLFTYPIRSAEKLLFRGDRSPLMCQFNRQFYENLGIYDEAFHQAMEYGTHQQDGCCLASLRQLTDYALEQGDWQVAEKYLAILDEAWLQGGFVEQRRARLLGVKEQAQKAEAENDSLAMVPLRGESFVGLYPLRSELVRLAYYHEGDDQKTVDYLLCVILLEKNLQTFYSVLTQFPNYQGRALPQAYQEALDILQSEGLAHRDAPVGTYANFFYNVSIEDPSQDLVMHSINE